MTRDKKRTVIDLSSSTLSTSPRSLLQKGLTFCPTAFRINHMELAADLHAFYRRLRLQEYFSEKPASWTSDRSALKDTLLRRHSSWQPTKGTYAPEVDVVINVFHATVQQAVHHQTSTAPADSLSVAERDALRVLQDRKDIIMYGLQTKALQWWSRILRLIAQKFRASFLIPLSTNVCRGTPPRVHKNKST